jgi:hypothetical protein
MNTTALPASAPAAASGHRRALLLILILSLLPIAVGLGLYAYGWRPQTTANHGRLIAPPVALATDNNGGLKGRWSLVVVGAPAGTEAARLDELRRVRASLAKEWKRTQHLGMPAAPAALADLAPGSVLIVDPAGLAMMRYAPGADLKGIRADLERLLKYSWIG